MIRATNTGATAAIDYRGVVTDQVAFGRPGLLFAQVKGMQGITPYSRWGNMPVLAMSLLFLMIGIGLKARRA
jgi:apolipoprotein N-acyltransferase